MTGDTGDTGPTGPTGATGPVAAPGTFATLGSNVFSGPQEVPEITVLGLATVQEIDITSDRDAKEGFRSVDVRDVLERVQSLVMQTWTFKTGDADVRHLGPMAQDFRAAFGLGRDERHITSTDADGVALAAIQGLYDLLQEKDTQLSALEEHVNRLETRLGTLEPTGDLDGPIPDYTEALRFNSDYADAYFNRGIARREKGDLDGAIQDFTEAIRIKPDYADAYHNRGLARSDKGDLDGALLDYAEAVRLRPDFAVAQDELSLKTQGRP